MSANIKFAGRVATLQADLEEATTDMYKEICMNSNLTDEQKTICAESLEIKLPRPRVLTNSNNSDYVQTIVQTAESIADVVIGRDTLSDAEKMPNGQRLKEKLMFNIVRKSAPFVDWEEIEQDLERIRIDLDSEIKDKKEDDTSM